MITLNPMVGVAPGTTTMQLGDCPPDESWQYVLPPQVTESQAPGVSPNVTQGPTPQYWNPYEDLPSLKGLGGFTDDLGNASWGLVAFAGVATFGIAFITMYLLSWRKRKRG